MPKTQMKLSKKLIYSQAMVLLFLALPSLVYTSLPVSSMAPGLFLALLIAVFLTATQNIGISRRALSLVTALCVVISIHFLFAGALQPLNLIRFTGSLILLAAMLTVSISIAPLIFDNIKSSAITYIFWLLIGCAVLGVLEIQPKTINSTIKPVFPFSEPSIFALSLSSVLMYECGISRGWRRILFCTTGLAIALSLQSLTLLVVVVFVLATSLPLRGIVILLAAALTAIAFSPEDSLSYYSDRLYFSLDSQNLTALVYLQGWQMMLESFVRSIGWGGGFQQLGVNPTQVEAADAIYDLLGGGSLNQVDGSFVLVKIISEFGVFGIVAALIYLRIARRSFKEFRSAATGLYKIPTGRMLAHAVILTFSIEIFLRGAGYLTGTAALFAASVSYILRGNENITEHPRRPLTQSPKITTVEPG